MPSFNLIDEHWIPVTLHDGSFDELSLRDVFARAPIIREIIDSSPLVTAALHRLLLAILHRNFGPPSFAHWEALWMQGACDLTALNRYFDAWRHRFDLFDTDRPFYQVPEMEDGRRRPVTALMHEAASGNNATLFDHHVDEIPPLLPAAAAARYLLACQAYSIGFGKSNPFYFQDAPLTRGFTVLLLGDNLFETLTLNLLRYDQNHPFPRFEDDLPVWERECLDEPDPRGIIPRGYLDYLTWQSRRVYLYPEPDGATVRWCQIQQGLKLAGDQLDPFKCFRVDPQQGIRPRGLDPERAVWRDCHALFQQADSSWKRPEVFNWVARIGEQRRQGKLQARSTYRIAVTGFASDRGKAASVVLWREERLPLPLDYLDDQVLLGQLRVALDLAETMAGYLRESVRELARLALDPASDDQHRQSPSGSGHKAPSAALDNEIRAMAGRLGAERAYWATLENPFQKLLSDLAEDVTTTPEGSHHYGLRVLPEWARLVYRSARDAFEEVLDGLDKSPRTIKAVALAEARFQQLAGTFLRRVTSGSA